MNMYMKVTMILTHYVRQRFSIYLLCAVHKTLVDYQTVKFHYSFTVSHS